MNDDLTAGEFEAVTGLTPKALRLYAERGILPPASVNPLNGYRAYERAQVRHGITLDLLRRAQVPMTDLVLAGNFDFEGRRQIVEVQRLLEDFHLDVAERVASFDPGDFIAHSHSAPAADWVGVIIDLALPEDIEGRIETFSGLALDAPAVGRGLSEALADLGMGRPEAVWTAVPDAPRSGGSQMLIAYPTPHQLDQRSRDLIAAQVRSLTGVEVTAAVGTLPQRLEVTFSSAHSGGTSAVDEAAAGYLQLLAMHHHLSQHHLTAIHATARQVVRGPSLLTGPAPISVFDVPRPVDQHRGTEFSPTVGPNITSTS